MRGQKIEGVLCLLKGEGDNRRGKRRIRIGQQLLDPGDVGLEDALGTVDEVADLWQGGDGQRR